MDNRYPYFLRSKALIYSSDQEFLITPEGIVPISQGDLSILKGEVPDLAKQWKHLIREERRDVNHSILPTIYSMKMAYQAALDISSRPDLKEYHLNAIQNATHQFEEIETTLSHTYRLKSPALKNRNYGEALCDLYLDRVKNGAKVLEIGCGTGYLANSFLSRLKDVAPLSYEQIHYSMFDLSESLRRDQRKNCEKHLDKITFIQGDIQEFQFAETFDLIISNEMIADLEVSPAKLSNFADQKINTEAEKYIHQYQLNHESAPPMYLVNVGAICFIEKLKSLLTDNGLAVVTEFGSLYDYPVAVKLSAHFEHSIRFADLFKVAEHHGLKTKIETVGDLLNFDGDYEVLSRDSYVLLSDLLLPSLGMKRLERLPYSREMLEEQLGEMMGKLINLQFYPLKAKRDLLNPFQFMALSIYK